jgi:hypothetical protein
VFGNKYQKNLRKNVQAKPTAEAIRRATGVDESIADVRSGNLEDNAINNRTLASGLNNTERAVTGEHIWTDSIENDHLADGTIEAEKLADEYAFWPHDHNNLADWPHDHENDNWFENHSHSSSAFIERAEEERAEMLEDRRELENLLASGTLRKREEILYRNTLNALKLQMDYIAFDAYERERRFKDPAWAEWTFLYKSAYGIDGHKTSDAQTVYRHKQTGIAPKETAHHH